jgi:hypothetical protein
VGRIGLEIKGHDAAGPLRAGLASGGAVGHTRGRRHPHVPGVIRAAFAGRRRPIRSRPILAMLRYDAGQTPQKWTRADFMIIAGLVFLILCTWAANSWRHYQEDETRLYFKETRAALVSARDKTSALEGSLADAQKQLDEANHKIVELMSVAARAPQLPVNVRRWRDSSTTYAVTLQNESEQGISVHVTVTNPDHSRSREQDCYLPGHRSINTPLRIYPHDTVIVAAEGFATKSKGMD